jgi:hypothetical protein
MVASKRKLAAAMTLLMLAIAGTAWSVYRARLARQQADFLASVTSSGGSIVMDYEDEGRPAQQVPLWLRGTWGDWPYTHVVKVKISNVDQLRVVDEFAELRELDLNSCPTANFYLPHCRHLRVFLDVNVPKYFIPPLEDLADFPELQVLDLSGANLDFNKLGCFKHMPQLRTLRLADAGIDDAGLRRLRFLKQLEELDVSANQIHGYGLTVFQEMTRLRKLDLHGNDFYFRYDTKLVPEFANLKDLLLLEELDLSKTLFSDEAMAVLAGLKNLKKLNLASTYTTDAGLRHLAGLTQLRKIDIRGSGVTPQGKQKLRAALPEVKFDGKE